METNSHGRDEEPSSRPARVLVVDDDPGVRQLFAVALELAGFATVTASDAAQAFERLDPSIAAVVLDNHLPDVVGTDVVQQLRGQPGFTTLPVLLVTGDDQLEQRVAGLRAGATDYLVKPVEPDELVARVAAQLRAQTAWHDVVDRQLRERAERVSSLFSIAPRGSAEDTAAEICEQVLDASHVEGVAIASLDDDGRAAPLAARGGAGFGAALLHLTNASPAYLAERAEQPWIERAHGELPSPVRLAIAPIRFGGTTVGLFALAPAVDAVPSRRETDQLLAEAIDYAGVATGLLGISLRARSERIRRRARLAEVVRERRFHPAYQPMVDLTDGHVVGYEALTRFDDGSRPDQRFAEAARLGLGIDLELATMASAVEAAGSLPNEHFLSLNITPDLALHHGSAIERVLRPVGRPVVLELTEHDPVDDYISLRAALDKVEPHVQVSVDDAGAGFASLRHVIMLRPDFVKLDRSWVQGVDHDPARQAMVAGLAHFARATGCVLVAEGIEEEAERATLAELGVDLGQGFLLGPPAGVRSVAPAAPPLAALAPSRRPAPWRSRVRP